MYELFAKQKICTNFFSYKLLFKNGFIPTWPKHNHR